MGLMDKMEKSKEPGRELGAQLELAEKMQTYTVHRRLRSTAFIFLMFAYVSLVPLLVVPYYLADNKAEWMQMLNLFLSCTSLLLLFAGVFMLHAILNLLEKH